MEKDEKYVELLWHDKYKKIELGHKAPIDYTNLPFQVVETVNKPKVLSSRLTVHTYILNKMQFHRSRYLYMPSARLLKALFQLLYHQLGLYKKNQLQCKMEDQYKSD